MSVTRRAKTYRVEFRPDTAEPLKEHLTGLFGEVVAFLEETPDEVVAWVVRDAKSMTEGVGGVDLTMKEVESKNRNDS